MNLNVNLNLNLNLTLGGQQVPGLAMQSMGTQTTPWNQQLGQANVRSPLRFGAGGGKGAAGKNKPETSLSIFC